MSPTHTPSSQYTPHKTPPPLTHIHPPTTHTHLLWHACAPIFPNKCKKKLKLGKDLLFIGKAEKEGDFCSPDPSLPAWFFQGFISLIAFLLFSNRRSHQPLLGLCYLEAVGKTLGTYGPLALPSIDPVQRGGAGQGLLRKGHKPDSSFYDPGTKRMVVTSASICRSVNL